ncbi:MAG TPA: hypothetical protein VEU96_07915 [Bryobacteraceae bacterium]|nr:hypothetical protein [Bryobacteraceae bacterium]
MIKDTLAWARSEAARLHRIRWALILLTNSLPSPKVRIFDGDAQEEAAKTAASKRELKTHIRGLKSEIASLRKLYNVHAKDEQLLGFLSTLLEEDRKHPHEIVYLPASFLNERFLKFYDFLPAHARIGIDPHGIRPAHSLFEVRQLDATLFEDVCSLFNLARNQHDEVGSRSQPRAPFKQMHALFRATLSAVFYLVEGYLNGLAFDHVLRFSSTMTEEDYSLMTEWDAKKNRVKFVSTRDKLLQYPRIILGLTAPPLQESNCPEMKLIVGSKAIRDSIVHCSPFPDVGSRARTPLGNEPFVTKEELFYSLSMTQVEEIVDGAISLVHKINNLVHRERDLDWLHTRGEDGFFSKATFD